MTDDSRTIALRQLRAVAASESARSLAGRRLLALGVLASLPVILALVRPLFLTDSAAADVSSAVQEFAAIFWLFILRFVVFFGAARAFVKAFRAEIMDETLHWSLLAPLPRSLLVAGKYLGALIATSTVLGTATLLTWILYLLPHAAHLQGFLLRAGLGHVFRYLLVVVLACAVYGALFLLIGLYFKSPMIPAILLLGWEALTPFLPSTLKNLTVVHHLASLLPLPVNLGSVALATTPPPAWLALVSLLAAVAVFLTLATWKARRLEVSYSAD